MVGYLAIGMFMGCLAGGIALYFGISLLIAFWVIFPMAGSATVLCVALARFYAIPFFGTKELERN